MEPSNKDRALIAAIKEIAAEKNISFTSLSHDWIVLLEKGAKTLKIYGYQFDLNPSAAAEIASDKAAASSLLERSQIPCVQHELFLKPSLSGYLSEKGNWPRALDFAKKYNHKLVCKANQGTGGNRVFRINTQRELEEAFQAIHQDERGLTISPYHKIDNEYRLIMLGSECLLCYCKDIPVVRGDGDKTYKQLLINLLETEKISELVFFQAIEDPTIELEGIPAKDELIRVLWKHNLGQGARPKIVENYALKTTLYELAERARACVGIEFSSIDVIETEGKYLILEINSGVMVENLGKLLPNGYDLAKSIYYRAVEKRFS